MTALALLKLALVVIGAVCLLFYPIATVWPSGWIWHQGAPAASDYFLMIAGLYATLGVFLILAARNPLAHRSLIWFTVVSSVVHGGIMALQSFRTTGGMSHMGHLAGDVPALFGAAAILGILVWRAQRSAA